LRRADRHELRARRGRPLHRNPGYRRAGALQARGDGPDAQARCQGGRRAGRGPEEGAEAALNRLLLATTNTGKLHELRAIPADIPMELVTPADAGIVFDVVEDGASYLENARKKAEAGRRLSGLATLADDSGLEVPLLGGRPGIDSAYFAGAEHKGDGRALVAALPKALGAAVTSSPPALVRPA